MSLLVFDFEVKSEQRIVVVISCYLCSYFPEPNQFKLLIK